VVWLVAGLPLANGAEEGAGPIHDKGGLFRPNEIARATKEIQDLQRDFGQHVVLETVKDIPHPEQRWYRFLVRRQEVNRFLDSRVRELAQATGAKGVYIVLCKSPAVARVLTWPDEPAPLFRVEEGERLQKLLVRGVKEHDPEQGLVAALEELRSLLQAHEDGAVVPVGVNGYTMICIVGGLLGVWAVLVLVRLKLGSSTAEPHAGPDMRPAFLGARFGSVAGHWLYDRLWPSFPRSSEPLAESPAEPAVEGHADGQQSPHANHEDAPV
jgi:hypothetical protein